MSAINCDPDPCFACGRPRRSKRLDIPMVETDDGQRVYVGPDCYRKIMDSGTDGYQPPLGGPRLYGYSAKVDPDSGACA